MILHIFGGFEEDNYKQTIDWLIKRRIRKVDVGYCVPERTEDSHPRFFLNCVNVGLVANIMNIKHKTRRFWGMLTFLIYRLCFVAVSAYGTQDAFQSEFG